MFISFVEKFVIQMTKFGGGARIVESQFKLKDVFDRSNI
jgi:hypothetical protein